MFHWLGWHGKDGASITGYDSRNPNVITHQLKAMKNLGGEGFGVIALSYGSASDFIRQAVLEMGNQCNATGAPFALCMDPWTVKNPDGSFPPVPERNARMITALNSPDIQFLLHMDCYLRGKPVLDFATGCDKTAVEAGVPGIQYWIQGPDYDWPKIPPVANKTKLPCVHIEFNDGTGADRNKSAWDQTKPARITPALAGATFWNDADTASAGEYIQFVTWNDVKEGTDVEKFASVLWGRI